MLTGERRPVSARRGMTVLGKIPAVPKPINLPSQRLENRGLDPNVEIVPRGSVSWGAAGRSPPTSTSPWGNSAQSSSPPVSSGPWGGAPPRPSTAGSTGSATASSGSGIASSGVPWGGHAPRPSSAGSGTRPSSAGSLRQTQEAVAAANAWGPVTARPSSASGVLGQAQSQPPVIRPRSAETRTLSPQAPALTRFAEQTNGPAAPPSSAWGGAGAARKLGEEPHQPSRFTLTRVDFPTLGSEKNPDLRPQQNKTGNSPAERTAAVDDREPPAEERPPPGPAVPYEEPPPTSTGAYGGQERMPEGWRRDARPYGGHPGMAEGNWHRDGPPPMQPYGGGQPPVADTWRREPGHGAAPGGGPSDDNWRRGGPPVGPYGPPGPGRFQSDPAGYMHQQRYGPGPGPGPYGRGGGPGPGGYGRHGDMYGNTAPFGRPGGGPPPRPGPPMGPGMFQGPSPYDNYYGPPGPGYGNMDEREMMMLGMGGPPGMYGNFPQGPPVEAFGRYPHGGPGPGPRHMPNNSGINRERNDSMGYEGEGYREGGKYKDTANSKDGAGQKDGGGFAKEGGSYKEGGRVTPYQDPGENRRPGHVMSNSLTGEVQRPSSRGGHHGSHRDWGAAASSDEPMDFSKPVFEEDVTSASPGPANKQAPSEPRVDSDTMQTSGAGKPEEHSKIQDTAEDVGLPAEKVKGSADIENVKETLVVQASKSSDLSTDDGVQTSKPKEIETGGPVPKSRVGDISVLDTKDQVARKVQAVDGNDSSEKRWGKDSSRLSAQTTRERSFGREHVFSPHGGRGIGIKKETNSGTSSVVTPGVASAVRPGQHTNGTSNSRPTLVSVSQGAVSSSAADSLVTEEVVSSSVIEKLVQSNSHASNPTSPSGSDSQKSVDKLRILKRVGDGGPESPHSDTVNVSEISQAEVLIVVPATEPPPIKDDVKPKSKSLSSHDGEKEWRPKVSHVADTAVEVPRSPSGASLKQPTGGASAGVSGGVTVATEKAGADLASVDSYDYEAQRARMKEIAAQRAIQLRKEEDERIKEQKAKALAKLEELNRRSLVVPVSEPTEELALDEAAEEPAIVSVQIEETEVVVSEVVVIEEVNVQAESVGGGTGVSTPRGSVRNGRNEHGKRERVGDRKGNGRSRDEHRVKMGSGEHRESTKGRPSMTSGQVKTEAPLLPPPLQQSTTPQPLLPSPSPGPVVNVPQTEPVVSVSVETSSSQVTHVHQQVPSKQQEVRHRGKQSVSQVKQAARQLQATVEAEHPAQAQEALADSADKIGGRPVGTNASLDVDSKDVTTSLGSSVVSSDGATAARKKKTKNAARNKHKHEGLTVSTDSTSIVDPNQGWNIDLSSSNDSGTEAGKPTPKAVSISGGDDAVKAVPSSVPQQELVPQDSKTESVAVEQAASTDSAGSNMGSFRSNGDLPSKRPQRKPQPVKRVPARERGTSQDVRVGDKPHGGDGMMWAPVRSPSGAHPAGPKVGFGSDGVGSGDIAGEKKEESVIAPQTARARRAELERYTPKAVVKQQAQQQEEMQQQQSSPSGLQQPGNESGIVSAASEVVQNSSLPEIKFGSEARQVENNSKQGRGHASWRQRASGSERLSTPKETHQVLRPESAETGGKSQQPSFTNQSQQSSHRSRPPPNVHPEQSRAGSSHQARPDQVDQYQPPTAEKEQHHHEVPQGGRSSHSNVRPPTPAATEKEVKIPQDGVTPYQPPRPGSGQKNRGLENAAQSSHESVRSHRVNTLQGDRQQGAPGKFERDHHGSHERGLGHPQSRSHSFRHQGSSGSQDRDQSHVHSGTHQQPRSVPSVQPSAPEGAVVSREKDQQNSRTFGSGQTRHASQSVHGQHSAPVSAEREQSHVEHVGAHQPPRSPVRQRSRQQAVPQEREQTTPTPHAHQQSRYRQPGHERDQQREVPNAVHHQQPHRGASDGHWQQTGGVLSERTQPSTDLGRSNEHSTRSTSHKSQTTLNTSADRDRPPTTHSTSHQHLTRPDLHNKQQGPAPSDPQKQPQYQQVSQHQKAQQQSGSQGPKGDNAHNSSHWNGERGSSPPALRGREHGHSRRGRFGGRYSGVGAGRGGEIENRREQPPKQRVAIDAAGGAVSSQVGG